MTSALLYLKIVPQDIICKLYTYLHLRLLWSFRTDGSVELCINDASILSSR